MRTGREGSGEAGALTQEEAGKAPTVINRSERQRGRDGEERVLTR